MSDYRTHSLITAVGERKLTDAAYCVDMVAQDKHTGEMILIERLNHPTGIATPGGHIEDESPIAAAVREMIEETGCPVLEIKYHSTLADPDRDPRGPKLSLVMSCLVDSSTTIDEPGKTKVTRVPAFEHLPNDDAFSLGHGPSVRKIWGDRLEVS